jgi:heme o synthase
VEPDRPGAWLRLSALASAAGAALIVVFASLGFDAAHRAVAALSVAPAVAVVVAAWWWHPPLRRPAVATLGLLLATASVGGLIATGTPTTLLHVAHVGLASLALAAAAVTVVRAGGETIPTGSLRDHITLTKPRIMSLLLVTGACGLVVGAGRVPDAGRFAAAMAGLALACGGASALNHVLDRDIDRRMTRTARRPIASGRISAAHGAEFGLALSAMSFVLLTAAVNPLSAVLALAGNLFYVLVYTGYLKRRTEQNIVIGGAAGAMPPLVGWAAARGDLDLAALLLFAIVFLWTPPHFWALAIMLRGDYERGGVPMLPVTQGVERTTSRIVRYTVALVAVTLLFGLVDRLGIGYLAVAAASGAAFMVLAERLRRRPTGRAAGRLFGYSLVYLAVVFAAAAVVAAA